MTVTTFIVQHPWGDRVINRYYVLYGFLVHSRIQELHQRKQLMETPPSSETTDLVDEEWDGESGCILCSLDSRI